MISTDYVLGLYRRYQTDLQAVRRQQYWFLRKHCNAVTRRLFKMGFKKPVGDANCEGDYWLFLPEDCLVHPQGWEEIRRHMDKGADCFALSKDPKALPCHRGIFQGIPQEIHTLSDMKILGKGVACFIRKPSLASKNG